MYFETKGVSLLKDKIVKTILITNKFNININFLSCRDFVKKGFINRTQCKN